MAASPNGQDIRGGAGQDEVRPEYAPSVQIIGILTFEKQQSDPKTASSGLPPYKSTVRPSSDPEQSEPKFKVGGLPVSYSENENGKRVPKKYNVVETPEICGHYEYVLQDEDGNFANNGQPVSPSRLAYWVDKSDKK